MELHRILHTAQDLFEMLSEIPEGVRERLGLQLLWDDEGADAPLYAEAYEVTETQGNIERGFRLSLHEEDQIDTEAELPLHPK